MPSCSGAVQARRTRVEAVSQPHVSEAAVLDELSSCPSCISYSAGIDRLLPALPDPLRMNLSSLFIRSPSTKEVIMLVKS